MNKKQQYIKQILLYILGLLFIAFAVAISINSNLGVSPVNSLPYVVSLIAGWDISTCIVGIYAGFILIQILLLRSDLPSVLS